MSLAGAKDALGGFIGLNCSFLSICTDWLSDIKAGHCKTGFYLNENFCCWGAEDGGLMWILRRGGWVLNAG